MSQATRGRVRRSIRATIVAALTIAALTGCSGPADGDGTLVRVPGDVATLAEAAERVSPGGVIEIAAGTYTEQLLIETPDVTVRGESRNETVIDGEGIRPYGIVAVADGVRVENLTVTGATFYGVLFTGLHDESGPSAPTASGYQQWNPADFPPLDRFLVDHVTAYNNGLYGIYAFNAHNGVIRDSYASGSADSGIYVGQCEQCGILITGNVAERNAVGFENANASDSVIVAGNRFTGNRIGVTLLTSYQEAFMPQRANHLVGNLIADNDEAGSPAHADGAFATGIGIAGGRDNVFLRNRITGNARAGVVLTNTEDQPASGNRFEGNVFADNAIDIANTSAARTPATDNCAPDELTTLPFELRTQLFAGCGGSDTPEPAIDDLDGPLVPPGISFLRVAPPLPQPELPRHSAYPPLPTTVTMPDLASFPVPDADFLADRAGTP